MTIRGLVRPLIRSLSRDVEGGVASLASQATSYLNGVAPYHWFDFINNRALYAGVDVGDVTQATGYSFSRASTGYYQNADGTLTSFASGALRRGDRGVLIEGARTNLLLRSQEFDNAAWSKVDTTITADAIAAPDGTTTADLCTEGTAGTGTVLTAAAVTVTVASPVTATIFAKRGNSDWLFVQLLGTGTERIRGWFNLATGAAGSATVVAPAASASVSIEALTDGWYRCRLTGTLNGAGSTCSVQTTIMSADTGLTRVNNSTRYMWGAQLEAASFPSSYIPTTTASATRAADVLTYTAGLTYPLGVFAQFQRPTNGVNSVLAQIDDGTNNERTLIRLSAGNLFVGETVAASAVQSSASVSGAIAENTSYKGAIRVTTNSVRTIRNGTLSTEDTSANNPTTPSTIRIGATVSGVDAPLYLERFAAFNFGPTDAQLQLMAPA